jgi:hypothetical protein
MRRRGERRGRGEIVDGKIKDGGRDDGRKKKKKKKKKKK